MADGGGFPQVRLRRLRRTPGLRELVRETRLAPADLILPLFIDETATSPQAVNSLPGVSRYPVEEVAREAAAAFAEGVRAVLLFGVPASRDAGGSSADDSGGVVQRAIGAIRDAEPELVIITDVCLCGYTDDGHCGLVEDGRVDNDATLERLASQALSHAEAGADIVAPSDMMDGRVGAIRSALDRDGFGDTAILSYAVKYASAFYGPFRDAAGSAPRFGDRSAYQMDPANAGEALREVRLDLREGADLVMVKPALPYLDVVARVRDRFDVPTAAYQVSGEYASLCAAADRGWLDLDRALLETVTSIRRAGADLVVTYGARRLARMLRG